jgi:MFS family permease
MMTRPVAGTRLFGVEFPPLVWMMLAGTLFTRTAFFMVWPFLAVILARDFHLPPATIGSIIGSAFLASGLIGFYSGNLSDRFGRRRIMTAGCMGAVCAYALLATAHSVAAYAVGAFLVGLTRASLESPGSALIGDNIPDQKTRHLALHARYFLINVGGAIGPLLGIVFGLSARQPSFWITAGAYAVYAGVLDQGFRRAPERLHPDAKKHASFVLALRVLRRDRRFLLLVASNFLVMSAYAQQESTLIQYVGQNGSARAVGVVAALLATNAVTIVACQFPLLRLLGGYDLYTRTYAGLVLFGAAFVAYAVLPVSGFLVWIVATWVLSVGEAILFPTLQLQIDRLAHDRLRGSYFGAAALGGLGFGVGPFVGGAMLGRFGGPTTFALTAAAVVLCGVCYWQSSRQPVGVAPMSG